MKTPFYLVIILSPHPKTKNSSPIHKRLHHKNPTLPQKTMARWINRCAIAALSTRFTSYFAFHKGNTRQQSKSSTIRLRCSIGYVIFSASLRPISKGITKKIKQNDGDVKKDIYFCNATPTLCSWQA